MTKSQLNLVSSRDGRENNRVLGGLGITKSKLDLAWYGVARVNSQRGQKLTKPKVGLAYSQGKLERRGSKVKTTKSKVDLAGGYVKEGVGGPLNITIN